MHSKSPITYFEQLNAVCKEKFRDILIDTVVDIQKQKETLMLTFDFRREDLIKYPLWENEKIKEGELEYVDDALHVYFSDKRMANFYFVGCVNEVNNKKEVEYFDDEGCSLFPNEVFKAEVHEPEELTEVINFLKLFSIHGLDNKDTDYSFRDIDFKKVFKTVNVFIPMFSDNTIELNLLKKNLDIIECERHISGRSYWDEFDEQIGNEESLEELNERYKEFSMRKNEFLETQKLIFQKHEGDTASEIMPKDILVRMGDFAIFSFYEYKRLLEKENNELHISKAYQDDSVYIVFRPAKNTSYNFLRDYFHHTNEGIRLYEDCVKNLSTPAKIKWIQGFNNQLLYALEKNIYRCKTTETMEKLIDSPDESEIALSNIKKRYKQLESFYNSDYKLLEIYKSPLPYSIDRAFRKFIRSSNEDETHRSGLHLLNVLIKSRIMLPLEEYLQKCQPGDDKIVVATEELLFKKPPSDGSIRDLYNLFSKEYAKSGIELSCFGKFHAALNRKTVGDMLRELIETRNRFTHPPFSPFFSLLRELLPELIDLYRQAFENIEIIVPSKIEIKNRKPVLSAKRLMGMDDDFETISIEVPLEVIEEFENNTLLAWNKNTHAIVKFQRFLKLHITEAPKFEIGFYDRLENGNPKYEF